MKILNTLFILLLFYSMARGQCAPSDYPQDITIWDLYLCGNPPSATDFKPQQQKKGLIHKTVRFHFPDDFWLDNLEAWFDFDDGQGLQLLQNGNTTYMTTYPSSGKKNITYYFSSDPEGQSVDAFSITIKEESAPYETPDIIWEIETPTAFVPPADQYSPFSPYGQTSKGRGNACVRLAEGHVNLTRPIIFVEGLDFGVIEHREPYSSRVIRFGDNGWDVFMTGALEIIVPSDQEELFKNVPTQFKDFTEAGYDIVLLDFEDGATYIQKNVEVLKALIRKINLVKIPDNNGLTHENIVVGASMGGIISRYALAQMEQDGETHCTSTYISFDAPHQGANIPLSMQSLIWFNSTFFEYNALDQDIEVARSLWKNINRPAPRQLLRQNLLGAYQNGNIGLHCFIDDGSPAYRTFEDYENLTIDYNALHTDLFSELDDLGYPQKTWNIALVNGNADGQNVGFEDGTSLLNADKWFGSIAGMAFKTKLWAGNGGTYSDEDFGESFSSDQTIFYGRRPLDFNAIGAPNVRAVAGIEIIGNLPTLDNAPGSIRRDIGNLIKPSIESIDALCCNPVNNSFPHTSFIPTISALDVNTEDLFFDIELSIDKDNPNSALTPFSRIYFPPSFESHVKTNEANRLWINEQISHTVSDLAIQGILPNSNGTTYNYGSSRKTVPSLTVTEGGALRINDLGGTAYLDPDLPANLASFNVFTKDCGSGNITIEKNGSLILGSDPGEASNKKGNLFVTDGNALHIQDGGTLRLQKGSQVIIESGAVLEIDAGANIDLWWSDSNIHIKEGGELLINGDFNFDGSGFFQFSAGNILTFAPGVEGLSLQGQGKDSRFIHINDGTLDIGNHFLNLSHGRITGGGSISSASGATVDLFAVDMMGVMANNFCQ